MAQIEIIQNPLLLMFQIVSLQYVGANLVF